MAPLNLHQTMALQGVFDEDPKQRAEYLKQQGYEMNPKNTNQFRPLGAQGEYEDIDPGFIKQIMHSGWSGFKDELFHKVMNNIPSALAMGATGAAMGAGAVEGAGVGSIPIALAQGTAVSAAIRAAKHKFANYMIGSDLPEDKKETMYHAFTDAVANKIGEAVVNPLISKTAAGLKDWIEGKSEAALDALHNNIGRGIPRQTLNYIAENPEIQEGAKVAEEALQKEHEKLTGIKLQGLPEGDTAMAEGHAADEQSKHLIKMQIGNADSIPSDSDFGKALVPLRAERDAKIGELAANPVANFKESELLDPLIQARNKLIQKQNGDLAAGVKPQVLTGIEQEALDKLDKHISTGRELFSKTNPAPDSTAALNSGDPSQLEDWMKRQAIPKPQNKPGSFATMGELPQIQSTLSPIKQDLQAQFINSTKYKEPEIDYQQARGWLSAAQQDIFEKDNTGHYVNKSAPWFSQIIGGGEKDGEKQIGLMLDQKAQQAGSDLPQTNAKISNVLTAYNGIKNVTPRQMSSALLPGVKEAGGDPTRIGDRLRIVDQVLGTNHADEFEKLGAQNVIQKLATRPVSVGSSNVAGGLSKAGGDLATGEAASHAFGPVGTAAKLLMATKAAVQAYKTGDNSNPMTALSNYIKQYAANNAGPEALSTGQLIGSKAIEAGQAAAPYVAPALTAGAADLAEPAVAALGDKAISQASQQLGMSTGADLTVRGRNSTPVNPAHTADFWTTPVPNATPAPNPAHSADFWK